MRRSNGSGLNRHDAEDRHSVSGFYRRSGDVWEAEPALTEKPEASDSEVSELWASSYRQGRVPLRKGLNTWSG